MKGAKRSFLRLDAFRLALYVGLLFPLFHFLSGIYGIDVPVLSRVEHAAQDYALTRLRGPRTPSGDVVIVGIDHRSIEDEGRWPWPRAKMARLIDGLAKAGVSAAGFDIVWDSDDEAERRLATVAGLVRAAKLKSQTGEIAKELDQVYEAARLSGVEVSDEAPTELLADSIEKARNVTLGFTFLTEDQATGVDTAEGVKKLRFFETDPVHIPQGDRIVAPKEPLALPQSKYVGVVAPLDVLLSVSDSGGFFTATPDSDGVFRRYMAVAGAGTSSFASLGVAVLARKLGKEGLPARVVPVARARGARSLGEVRIGDLAVETDDLGHVLLNYYGKYTDFPAWSATDVLHGRIPPEKMKGKVVVVGTTAFGTWDGRVTPFDSFAPGVITHATFMENALHHELLVRTPAVILAEVFVLIAAAFVMALVFSRVPLFVAIPALVVVPTGIAGVGVLALGRANVLLAFAVPMLQLFAMFLAATSYRFLNEERERRKARETFSRFLAPAIVEQVLERQDSLRLGGDKRELTCLFADIRGFTTISEQLDPHVLLEVLNEYLTPMTDIIVSDHQGTLDKYIGDAIMAFWGAPQPQDDHALRACRAALAMIEKLENLRTVWKERGLPHIDIGVGINTGPMSVGFVGSQDRFYNYTVLGDAVNLSSRLEGANRQYGTHILIGPVTREMVKDQMVLREIDRVRVKGKREPVQIYELLGEAPEDDAQAAFVEAFQWGLSAYQAQRWDEAIGRFKEAIRLTGTDATSDMYVARCEAMRREPPGPQWDGVYEMRTK